MASNTTDTTATLTHDKPEASAREVHATEDNRAHAASPSSRAVDLFIGVSGPVDLAALREAAIPALATWSQSLQVQIAYPGHMAAGEGEDACREDDASHLAFTCYALPTDDSAATPWAVASAAERTLLGRAAQLEAKVAVLLHPDLQLLTQETLHALASPVLDRRADLVTPVYSQGPYDGLLNHAILAPLTRALYGRRVRFPLASDLAVSARMVARLLQSHGGQAGALLWPGTTAATIDASVAEAPTHVDHGVQAEGLDLQTVLAQLVGPLFAEMEPNAPLWQRVRNSQPLVPTGNPPPFAPPQLPAVQKAPDVKVLVDSFVLGSRSLMEIWSHVLPPITLLELKRLTTLAPERFRMPDELWVRIVYDFALAYRLRSIGRTHLLGALAPLYLGWVASWVNGMGVAAGNLTQAASAQQEQLARAFEDGKPYLVRRWRWPDRFNP
jgi:glucosylglycerate synthase